MRTPLVLAALLALAACGSSTDGTDAGAQDAGGLEPKLSAIQSQVFAVGCAVSGCHDGASHEGNLVLTSASTSYANLVGVAAYEIAPRGLDGGGFAPSAPDSGLFLENLCEGLSDGGAPPLRVAAGDPDLSYLVWKITGSDAHGAPIEESRSCGKMPKVSGAALPQAQLDAIRQWIANGAQND